MKKLTSLILALVLVHAFAVPAFAVAETATVTAAEGWTNATYDSETSILTDEDTGISFLATLNSKKTAYSLAYNGTTPITATRLVLPGTLNGKPISSIGSNICGNKADLVEVIISEGTTSISKPGFSSYSNLETAVLPSTCTTLGQEVFRYCGKLSSVNLPEGITKIDNLTFQNCYALQSITLPSTLTSFGTGAFNGAGLTEVTIPANVHSLGKECFKGNAHLEKFVCKGNITSISTDVFRTDYALKTVIFEGNTDAAPTLSASSYGSPFNATSGDLTVYYPASAEAAFTDPEFVAAATSVQHIRPLNVPFVTAGDVDTAFDAEAPETNEIVSWATITFPDYVAGYQYGIVAYEGEGDFDATTSGATLYRALGHKDGIFGVKLIGDLVTSAIRTRTYMFDGTNYTYGD